MSTLGASIYAAMFGEKFPRILWSNKDPFIKPASCTMGNNGALSDHPALNMIYDQGSWTYFDASQLYAGSTAGWYWTVWSSTTAATVYANTYTPGGDDSAPASPTAIVATGPGAITGSTSEITCASLTLPALANGQKFWVDFEFSNLNGANAKYCYGKVNAYTFMPAGASTSVHTRGSQPLLRYGAKCFYINFGEVSSSTTRPVLMIVDLRAATTVTFSLYTPTAGTDWIVADMLSAMVM